MLCLRTAKCLSLLSFLQWLKLILLRIQQDSNWKQKFIPKGGNILQFFYIKRPWALVSSRVETLENSSKETMFGNSLEILKGKYNCGSLVCFPKFFDTTPFKRWSLILLPLNMGWV